MVYLETPRIDTDDILYSFLRIKVCFIDLALPSDLY